jgi:HSP20 family protein
MYKLVKSLILAVGLSTTLNAGVLFQSNNIDDEFTRMQNFINSMLNSSLAHQISSPMYSFGYPKVNIEEKDNKYILMFELAGIDKKDIKLTMQDNMLFLEGEQKNAKENKNKEYIKQEIYYGKFKRAIELPSNVKIDKVTTNFKNGILTVTIPKNKVKKSNIKTFKIK